MRINGNTLLILFSLLFCFVLQQNSRAQCAAPISSFPYNQDFESSDGNWLPDALLHWQWCGQGTPAGAISKPVINTAGGGARCWIAGGASGSSYNSAGSTLQSPCFDFSTLVNPEISFKIFWETEKRWDGANLEYSTDGGSAWSLLGSESSNSSCLGVNWYNYNPVEYLSDQPGWSGNIQNSGGGGNNCWYGAGSGHWLTAKHNIAILAGLNNVIFRFAFGAGTECNNFDGFAFDDIHIGEAAPDFPDFSYTCGANNTVTFINNSSACTLLWDFGDPASGAANTSTSENPTHVFSDPGTYNVSLTGTYSTGTPPPKIISLTILGVVTEITNTIKCNGNSTGAIKVNVTGGSGIYNYSWNTNPVQTSPAVNNLSADEYIITVTSPGACSVNSTVALTEPAILSVNPVVSPAKCGNDNGSVLSGVSGGTPPYVFMWSNGEGSADISNLSPGLYNLSVEDDNGCTASRQNIEIKAVVNRVNVFLGNDTTICPGQTLLLKPGNFSSYKWQDNSTGSSLPVTKSGIYYVEVTDKDGCKGNDSIRVTVDCKDIYFPSAFTPNADALNNAFGAVGDLASLKNFSINIYNRLGQLVFSSSDAYRKWDGLYKGFPVGTQSFVWLATYVQKGRQPQVKKGIVTVWR